MGGIILYLLAATVVVVGLKLFLPVAVILFGDQTVKEVTVALWGAFLVSVNFVMLFFVGFFYKRFFYIDRPVVKILFVVGILFALFRVDYWYYESCFKEYSGETFVISLLLLSLIIFGLIYDLFGKYHALRSGDIRVSTNSSKVLFVLAFGLIMASIVFRFFHFNVRVPGILGNLGSGTFTSGGGQSIVLNSKFNDPKNPWLSVTLKPGRYSIEARGYIDVNINVNDPRRPEFDRVPPRGVRVSPISGQFPFPEFTNNNTRGCSLIVQPKGERTKAFEVDGYREFITDTTINLGFTINDDVLEDNGGEGWTIIITPLRNEGGHNSIVKNIKEMFGSSLPPEIQSRLRSLGEVGWSGGDANKGTTKVSWFTITSVEVADNTLIIRYPWQEGVMTGRLENLTYKGEWIQANGSGKFELNFNPDYSRADGWWSPGKKPSERWFFALK